MEIILKPVLTEKMTAMTEKLNKVAFIVDIKANKFEIKNAIQERYDVKVVSVNTVKYQGKSKSRYTKAGVISGRTNSYKKAIITLSKNDSIDFFSNI